MGFIPYIKSKEDCLFMEFFSLTVFKKKNYVRVSEKERKKIFLNIMFWYKIEPP